MARPSHVDERRESLLPVIAEAFGTTGYRRTTTAQLAAACGLQETQLYRVWPSKKAMFLAVLDYLFELESVGWLAMLEQAEPAKAVDRILADEGKRRGDSGLHRITLAALSESDDPEIHAAVQAMYRKFHAFIVALIERCRAEAAAQGAESGLLQMDPKLVAWTMIGLGTMVNIGREFDLFSKAAQRRLLSEVGGGLIHGA